MKSNIIARSGMIVALNIVVLLLTLLFKTITISLLALTTIINGIFCSKHGAKITFLSYMASSILAFFLVPDRNVFLFYSVFFGNYAVIKALIESKNNLVIEWIYKIIVSIIYAVVLIFISKVLIVSLPFSHYIFIGVFMMLFIMFDVFLSVFLIQIIPKIKF